MNEYTDFIIALRNGEEIMFRHNAKSVREFVEQDGEIIYDIYESQCIKKCEIMSVRLNPIPFAIYHFEENDSTIWGMDLRRYISSLSQDQREKILRKYKL